MLKTTLAFLPIIEERDLTVLRNDSAT